MATQTTMNTRIPESLLKQVRKAAEKEDLTVSQVVRMLLREWLKGGR